MNQNTHMQPTDMVQGMFAHDAGAGPPPSDSHVESQRSMDPHVSLEDYNRHMLEYTQRQMSSFVDLDDNRDSGSSGRSSESSGSSCNSGRSSHNSSVVTSQANAPPTSAGAAAAKQRSIQEGGKSTLSSREAQY
jgi:hypothetical protein